MSADTILLQTELLQLEVMHSSFEPVRRAWESSAKEVIRRHFEDVACAQLELEMAEQEHQERKNLCGLRAWASASPDGSMLDERARLLGPLIMDLIGLTTAGGQYAKAQTEFERWVAWITDVWSVEGQPSQPEGVQGDVQLVEDLGDGWTATADALSRRLINHERGLRSTGEPLPGTSIGSVIATCKALVAGMLEELDLMRTVRADIVECEKGRVNTLVASIAADVGHTMDSLRAANNGRRALQRPS